MTPAQHLAFTLVLWGGAAFLMLVTRKLEKRIAILKSVRRQNLRIETDTARKLALIQATACQAAQDKRAAEFERNEAAWLYDEAHKLSRSRPASRDEQYEFGNSLSRHIDWSKS